MALHWSKRQQAYVISTFVAIVLMIGVAVAAAVLYESPTCFDGIQNQNERGVDCGGSCEYLCRAEVSMPFVSFARPLIQVPGRIDVAAYIENRNQHAEAKNAPYVAEVFDAQGRTLGSHTGTIDLPARTVVPLFIPGVASGTTAARAFITFGDEVHFRTARSVPADVMVSRTDFFPGTEPRVVTSIANTTAYPIHDRMAVATVYGPDDVVIAASRTVIRFIDAFGAADAIFTWPQDIDSAARVEVRVVPVIP